MNHSYSSRLEHYKEIMISRHISNEYLLVSRYILNGNVDCVTIEKYCSAVRSRNGKADFQIISLIRFLYTCNTTENNSTIGCIEKELSSYPFWPNQRDTINDFDDTVFWSENHLLMLLSSAHLYQQHAGSKNLTCRVSNREIDILKSYLHAHCSFEGFYESLSHCYLPYTLSSLFNLFDYSNDIEIKNYSEYLINIAIDKLILCTTNQGIATLTASTRSFPRFIFSKFDHNINQLIYLLIGISPDDPQPTPISDFLLTTTWRPDEVKIQQSLEFSGYQRIALNHALDNIFDMYNDISEDERVPIYWYIVHIIQIYNIIPFLLFRYSHFKFICLYSCEENLFFLVKKV